VMVFLSLALCCCYGFRLLKYIMLRAVIPAVVGIIALSGVPAIACIHANCWRLARLYTYKTEL
jgi:hypothetical protein